MTSFAPWTRRRRQVDAAAAGGVGVGTAAPVAALIQTRAQGGPDCAADPDASSQALVARLGGSGVDAQAALATLYEREAGPVYRYALALCGNSSWAADATQEAFIALATRPGGFDASRGTAGAYLAGVARHALAAQRHALRLLDPLPDDDGAAADTAAQADHGAAPETLLVQAQQSAQVWAALRQLPALFREAVVLVDLQERPYAEAARIAGIELNTLRTRVHRARLKLAALLGAAGRRA